jgi:hypothetical protein
MSSMVCFTDTLAKSLLQILSEHNLITSIESMQTKRTISSECGDTKGDKHSSKSITGFDDLPDELLLIICRYLTPVHVLNAFLNYNDRLFHCITDYRTHVDLTRYSYEDYQNSLLALTNGSISPLTLIVSNQMISTQIPIFFDTCRSWIMFNKKSVQRLSLLECTMHDIYYSIDSYIEYFTCLRSLRIVESVSGEISSVWIDTSIIESLRKIAFSNNFNALIELELITNKGLLLDKQLRPNQHLKQLIISLQTIDDLLVLIDGLVPNLTVLNITLSKPSSGQELVLPPDWPRQFMSHLMEFRLTTNVNATLKLDHLRSVVMPLLQLETFVLDVKQWANKGDRFVQDNEIEVLINEFMPHLRNFHCCIQTMVDIDIQVRFIH